jgi:hypothetical protein
LLLLRAPCFSSDILTLVLQLNFYNITDVFC